MLDRQLSVCQHSRVMTPQVGAEPLDEAIVDIRSCVPTPPVQRRGCPLEAAALVAVQLLSGVRKPRPRWPARRDDGMLCVSLSLNLRRRVHFRLLPPRTFGCTPTDRPRPGNPSALMRFISASAICSGPPRCPCHGLVARCPRSSVAWTALGLAVNIASVWLLSGGEHPGHSHGHGHGGHDRDEGHRIATKASDVILEVFEDGVRPGSGCARSPRWRRGCGRPASRLTCWRRWRVSRAWDNGPKVG
jgi:hypothetical protein